MGRSIGEGAEWSKRGAVFHVKQSLPDAEIAEDGVEQLLHVDPAGDAAQ
jgi:hypothetical protein